VSEPFTHLSVKSRTTFAAVCDLARHIVLIPSVRACNKTLPDIRRWSLFWFDVIQAQQITCSNGVTSPKKPTSRYLITFAS
jgi:hypothetical protein